MATAMGYFNLYLELFGLLILLAGLRPLGVPLRKLLKLAELSDWLAILYGSTLWARGGMGLLRDWPGVLGLAPGVVEPGRRGIPERGVGIRLLPALLLR